MKEAMEDGMRKNQEFMLATQKMQMERQMMMQQMMQQKMMSMQLARSRELFTWTASFAGTVSLACIAGFLKKKNPAILLPIVPLGFTIGYQYDAAYGDKMIRIRADAEHLLQEQENLVAFPNGMLNFKQVEEFRLKRK